jgi:TPR repeat protein
LEAAATGQAWAQIRLAVIYSRAPNDAERWRKALSLLQAAAEKSEPEAFYQLAALSTAGRGVELSQVTAFEHMKRSAELGLAEGQYELASMYAEGRGTAKDMDAALDWGLKAAQQGYLQAQFSVGRVMVDSVDPKVRNQGLEWMTKAAQANHSEAILTLATAYGTGRFGLAKDEAKAEALLKPAAERGDADCQFVLAALYKFGDSYADRRELARPWMERAAASGHLKAREVLQAEAKTAPQPTP